MGSIAEIVVLEAQLNDAFKDTTRWLSVVNSNEEALYVRDMQAHLGNLLQILDRVRIRYRVETPGASEEPPLPSMHPQWKENVVAYLNAFRGAEAIHGGVVGGHLKGVATRLEETIGGSKAERLRATVNSPIAAKRMEAYLKSKGIGQTDFATTVGTTDRTLRSFRKTGKVRRDILESIAKHMGTTREALLKE